MESKLTCPSTKCKVKSTLNKSIEFAAKHMFDGKLDTCWNSDQGSPQHILLDFVDNVSITNISITFQGGFVGQDAVVELGHSIDSLCGISILHSIEDSNDQQIFPLSSTAQGRFFKLTFPSSTDFYGRVTIYNLEVFGMVHVSTTI